MARGLTRKEIGFFSIPIKGKFMVDRLLLALLRSLYAAKSDKNRR